MTKQEFLDRLRQGLRGIPRTAGEEIMADMEGHFADGKADGRTEAEIAAALGDPVRLARELRADAGIKQWEEKRSPSNAATAVFAILGLGAIDFLILLPILLVILSILFGLTIAAFVIFVAIIAVFLAGFAVLMVSFVHSSSLGSAPHGLEGALTGLGLIAGAVSWGALHTLICIGIVNALVWYGRLHLKVINPTTES